jgi:hypothetical protein
VFGQFGFRVLVTVDFDKVTDGVLGLAKGKTGRDYFDAVMWPARTSRPMRV